MLKISPANFWRRLVSYSKYPLLFSYELGQGLIGSHKVVGFKARMRSYCRFSGGSHIGEKEAQAFALETKKLLKTKPVKILEWRKDYDRHIKKYFAWLKAASQKAHKKELTKLELKKYFFWYERDVEKLWYWGYLPFLINEPIEEEVTVLLIKLGVKEKEIPKAIAILSSSKNLTLHQQEGLELLNLAVRVRRLGFKKCEKEIEKHKQKWIWKKSWFYNQSPLTLEELEKEIKILIKKNPAKILAAKKKEAAEKWRKRKEFLDRYKNRRLNLLADILATTTLWHTVKVEHVTLAVHLVKPIFTQLAAYLNLSLTQFGELLPEEVKKEKFKLTEVNERVKDSGVFMSGGKIIPLSGKILEEVKKKINREPGKVKSLKGFPVFPGKLRGRVLKVSERQNTSLVTVKPDSILVTSMTTTNMNPLISKVKAIVTNEGGILCHAAIIAREFKKPCIVGTKIATQVLHDGDLVEVDANKGIVKIIK